MNFTFKELINSDTAKAHGIDNTPNRIEYFENMMLLVCDFLQPLRNKLKKPIIITSGYRSKEVNQLVGGVSNSQHLYGQAVDIVVNRMTPLEIYNFICDIGLNYDQIIIEPSWLHCSYTKNNRKEFSSNVKTFSRFSR